jgi:transposase
LIDPEDVVVIDETGFNVSMARTHGRAPSGERVVADAPVNHGQNITVMGAVTTQGVLGTLMFPGSTDGPALLAFVQQMLVPKLRPGQIVIWDNLGAHRMASVTAAVEAAGAVVCQLPPYSPDFSPIEMAWSKIKTLVRSAAARTREALVDAVAAALARVTKSDLAAWFRHCGFCHKPSGDALYTRLFAIEAESKALREDFDARLARRLVRSRPLVKELWSWVDAMRPKVEPRTPLGKALTYLTRQRPRLEIFLADGRLAMTNNAVERELRTHVLNRKTWLFCGSEQSARRTAAGLSIVRTCRLLGVEPRASLRFVVRRILAGERDPTVLWPENFAVMVAETTTAA